MKSACIDFHEIPHTTRLFSAFLDDFEAVSQYFAHPPTAEGIVQSAHDVRIDPQTRRTIAAVLSEQNRRFAHDGELDEKTSQNLARLETGAVAIVTGQQVGLFSGPALTVYKAISAIRCAEEVTKRGIEAIPIFWLATQDHDLAEVNESFWNTRNGLARYELSADPQYAGRSVGQILLGESIQAIVAAAAESLDGPAAAEIARALRESYSPMETYGSAFAKLLARMLAGRGLLLIDPRDPRLDALAAPTYRAALEQSKELTDTLLKRSSELEENGYHAQVKVTRESTLLFYSVDGRREPVRRRESDSFSAGSKTFSKAQLLTAIEKTPEVFTASALLRPVIQDSLLPTAAYLGGPAEVAYMAQAQVIYERLLGRMPAVLPRASFTVIEPPIGRFMDRYDLDIRDVFRGPQHLRAKMEQHAIPDELEKKFESDEIAIRKLIDSYRGPIERLDRTLLGTVDAVEEKTLHMFLRLKEKIGRAENFRTGVLDRHEAILLNALYTNHELQERVLSSLPFFATHGLELIDDILSAMPPPGAIDTSACARKHHVLFLD